MKKNIGFKIMRKNVCELRYVSGVPAAEKKHFWAASPWDAFRLLLQEA